VTIPMARPANLGSTISVVSASTVGQKSAQAAASSILIRITCITVEDNKYSNAVIILSNALEIKRGFLPYLSDSLPLTMPSSMSVIPQLVPNRPISVHDAPKLDAYSGTIGVAIPIANINAKMKPHKLSRPVCFEVVRTACVRKKLHMYL
jgi:hypothetical protein